MKFTSITILLAAIASTTAFVPHQTAPSFVRTFAASSSTAVRVTKDELLEAQEKVDALIKEKACGPIMIRLAWHDSGSYDKNIKAEWPGQGGATGSIRFGPELAWGGNAGLQNAIALLEPIKAACPNVGYADLFQMASARSIALMGGPVIDMKYGRVDAESAEEACVEEGNLPDAAPDGDGNYGAAPGTTDTKDTTPNGHIRKVFARMGLSDEDCVALSGAHTVGRAWKDRSGLGADKTKFTDGKEQPLVDGTSTNAYKPGGSSWTEKWLIFDNSYFTTIPDKSADPELLKLNTDVTLFDDEVFKPFAEKFRDSQDAFFESYKVAHKKLSELGSKFEPEEGITL